MSQKQDEVLKQVQELMQEHFDGYVVIVHMEDVNDQNETKTMVGWHGSLPLSMGMVEYARRKLGTQMWSELDEKNRREEP